MSRFACTRDGTGLILSWLATCARFWSFIPVACVSSRAILFGCDCKISLPSATLLAITVPGYISSICCKLAVCYCSLLKGTWLFKFGCCRKVPLCSNNFIALWRLKTCEFWLMIIIIKRKNIVRFSFSGRPQSYDWVLSPHRITKPFGQNKCCCDNASQLS